LEEAATTAERLTVESTWDDEGYYDISFAVHKSRRYHAKMASFYRGCHHFVVASSALTGTSAFVALLSDNSTAAKWLTGIVAVASTLDLVFAFSERADQHEALRRRFTDLAAHIAEWSATPENLARARSERLRIEADSSEEKRLVDLQADNEEARARGVRPEDLIPLSRPQRWFGYVLTFGMRRIEEWHNQHEARRRVRDVASSAPS
jgi:hypothetical protein